MSSFFGSNVKVSIFGQSHSIAIGVTVDGLPAGKKIDMERLTAFMERRAPGTHSYSTPRKEADMPHFISGLVNGITCGAPLTAVIQNNNTRSQDYEQLRDIPRPAHADYTADVKYHSFQDTAGGGHFSGRLTAPMCIAGGICMQMLDEYGIRIRAHIKSIGGIEDSAYVYGSENNYFDVLSSDEKAFPVLDRTAGEKMRQLIDEVRQEQDSIGGTIECVIDGVMPGIGAPMFDGIENVISQAVFAVPAIKGLEFGNGFECAGMKGSENNDAFCISQNEGSPENVLIRTKTNRHGGILGGISSGMPIVFRVAVKPTPSIGKTQDSVRLSTKKPAKLEIRGRHDPCIVPRAVPCIEAAAAIALYDMILGSR